MLTATQLTQLRAACFNDVTAAAFIAAGQANELGEWLNQPSDFVVWKKQVETDDVGQVISYIALEAMTVANRDRVQTFYVLNPVAFEPRSDIRSYFAESFSGALAGEGENTRASLESLWRRPATHAERLLATGVGSEAQPGDVTWEGNVPGTQAVQLVYQDNGTIWTQGA